MMIEVNRIPENLKAEYEACKERLHAALAVLPACPDDCIRLYRGGLEGDSAYRESLGGKPKLNSFGWQENPALGYVSTIEAAMGYINRQHKSDEGEKPSNRLLSYVDVPIEEARNLSKANEMNLFKNPKLTQAHVEFLLTDELIKKSKPIKLYTPEEFNKLPYYAWYRLGGELDYVFSMPGRLGEVEIHRGEDMVQRLRERESSTAEPPLKR